jgi:hypothetical protein
MAEALGAGRSVVAAEGPVRGEAEQGAGLAVSGTTSAGLGISEGCMTGTAAEAESLAMGGTGGAEHGVDRRGEAVLAGAGKLEWGERGCGQIGVPGGGVIGEQVRSGHGDTVAVRAGRADGCAGDCLAGGGGQGR